MPDVIKIFEDMKKGIYPYYPNEYFDIAIRNLEAWAKVKAELRKLADDEWNKSVGRASDGFEGAIEIIEEYEVKE